MTSIDDFTRSLKDICHRIAVDSKRTAMITKLRMELTGLDRRRREILSRLGARVDELRRTGQIHDAGLLGLLEVEFEDVDRIEKRIDATMTEIQEINLQDEESIVEDEAPEGEEAAPAGESMLDSFDVI